MPRRSVRCDKCGHEWRTIIEDDNLLKCPECKSKDMLSPYDKLRPHAADVLAVVRAMAEYDIRADSSSQGWYYCDFCNGITSFPISIFQHTPDCPVLKAQKLVEMISDGKG